MKSKILILGDGYIAGRLNEELAATVCMSRIRRLSNVEKIIKRYRPRVIVNAIGFTGRNMVDDCEKDTEKTIQANSFVPLLLAEAAIRHNIKLVHISSGCIYHYNYRTSRPLTELKSPDYFDLYYSRTKIYSERALLALCREYNILIIRIRIPLDDRPHRKNLLTKLIRYRKVIDSPNSVTYVPDFIKALRYLLRTNARGVFNVVNGGALRYARLLKIYQRYVPDFEFTETSYRRLQLKRTNLILSNRKLLSTGFRMRSINAVLDECVQSYCRGRRR